jgi:hypothetical protein
MFDPMKAFINLPMWARLAIALTIAVGMFLFIAIQAEKQYDREDPFMTVCWNEGVAHYPDEADKETSCPSGEELLQWDKKTKTVRWDFIGTDFDVYLDSHSRAIERINDDLGFEALSIITSGPADITMEHGMANIGNGSMSTSHYKSSVGAITAIIRVKTPKDTRSWMLEERHELLHALGLAHKSSGIMKRSVEEPSDRQLSWLLRPNDRKALRKLLLE